MTLLQRMTRQDFWRQLDFVIPVGITSALPIFMPAATPPRYWIVRRSSIHHRGLFARTDIPKDSPILEYVGEKITKAESDRRGKALLEKSKNSGCAAVYIFTLNKRHDLDGGKAGNPARLINHSCDPNCEAYIIRGRVWIYSRKDIKAGDELTYNYGFDLETWEDHPCRCGSTRCAGHIVDEQYWPQLRRLVKKREQERKKMAELEARAAVLQKRLDDLQPVAPGRKSRNGAHFKKVNGAAQPAAAADTRRPRAAS
ncbi:MAG TPA: hypothetical protein DIT13_17445 [Verrucomicrobiales bacterium]|nr:hypothetical protein [Verrucomicrobiales bacterium]